MGGGCLADRLDVVTTRLNRLPSRISALAVAIARLRARRAEKYDFGLEQMQREARAIAEELWPLSLEVWRLREDVHTSAHRHQGPRIGRPRPTIEETRDPR